jgi:copper oxidase (laccase) domain-containing protein
MQNTGFVRREAEGIAYYSCTALENVPHLCHAFSTRHGGVSSMPAQALNLGSVPWDTAAHVLENRRRFLSALNIRPLSLATVSQVHSAEFHIIKTPAHQWNPRTPGDGLATAEEGVALAVQVADCFPVLLADPQTGAIAAVHAGWRGRLFICSSRKRGCLRKPFRISACAPAATRRSSFPTARRDRTPAA